MKQHTNYVFAVILLVVLSACGNSPDEELQYPGWTTYTTANSDLIDNSVNALVIHEDGRIFVGTDEGMNRIFLAKPRENPSDAYWATPLGSECTLIQWFFETIIFVSPNSCLTRERFVNALAIDKQGEIVIGGDDVFCTDGLALGGYKTISSTQYSRPPLGECDPDLYPSRVTPPYLVTTIAIVGDLTRQTIWLGTSEYGVKIFHTNQRSRRPMAHTTANSELVSNTITAITLDPDGSAWIGTPRGISVVDDQDWTTLTVANSGLVSDNITAIVFDSQGRAWIGTANGLSVFDEGIWTTYTSANSDLVSNAITTIAIDSLGRIWVGTEDGLSLYDQEIWITYTTDNSGLVSNRIAVIAIHPEGHVWIGTDQGLNVFEYE